MLSLEDAVPRISFRPTDVHTHIHTREEERRRRKKRRKESRRDQAITSPSTSNTGCLKASRNIWNKNDLKCRILFPS
ncbi:hypothetical protein LEMLEM_LOCUS8842 [Lemmus lemmus]